MDGSSINIWRDRWLDGEGSGKIISPCVLSDSNLLVSSLIDVERFEWRAGVLNELFLPIDVERIIKIPISPRLPNDSLYWFRNKDGVFRVKDAYRLAMEHENVATSSNGYDPIWTQLWKLKVPPKISNLVWRAYWDIIPHKINLCKKMIVHDTKCFRCGEPESTLHVLRDCIWARSIWEEVGMSFLCEEATSFREWIVGVLEAHSKEFCERFAMLVWQIWRCRNEDFYQGSFSLPRLAMIRACDLLTEYREVHTNSRIREAQSKVTKWSPPSNGRIKINFDAAVKKEYGRVGVGVIVRDDGGNVVKAKAQTIIKSWDAEMAEAFAARTAAQLAADSGWRHVIIEGDAAVVIKALQRNSQRNGYIQLIIDDTLHFLSCFDCIEFNFCYRSCNEAAHRLSKWAVTSFCDEVWYGETPSWLSDVLVMDSSNIN